jgi:RNA polymerase sigma-70 factor (ECF subfamily)
MHREEKLIIKGIQKGNKVIFQKLYENHYHRLFLYAKSYIENDDLAEDITQDIFFTLWEKRNEIVIKNSISSYLYRAVHNKCVQHLRHQKITEEYQKIQLLKQKEANILYYHWNDSEVSSIESDEIEKIISATIESFPEKTKNIFSLSRKEHLQNKEISQKLNVDIKTVEYHISKALKSFREALKDYL